MTEPTQEYLDRVAQLAGAMAEADAFYDSDWNYHEDASRLMEGLAKRGLKIVEDKQ